MGGKAGSQLIGGLLTIAGAVAMFIPGGQYIGASLIGAGLSTIAASFMPVPGAPSFTQTSESLRHTFRGAVTPHKIIYGQVRVSGPLYELGSTGPNNEFLHVIIPIAGHELNSIGNVIVNDTLMDGDTADAKYAPYIRVNRHLGGVSQVADTDLIAELKNEDGTAAWSTAHIGNGIAYIYVRFKYNSDIFPSGIKNIQVDVQGKKIYDPRTALTAWTDCWALCMRDYLMADFGIGLASTEVDDAYFIAAANTSEEIVTTAGGTQNRYTCNGVVDLSQSPTTIIKSMLTAGAGHLVPLVEGAARLIPGAYSTPTVSLDTSHLRGPISYKENVDRKSLFNTVIGKYSGEESDWQVINYPQVGVAAYVTADGSIIKREIELPFCTDHERCQRISMQVLKNHRAGGVLKMPCKLSAIEATTMEVVYVTIPELGFANETFRVTNFILTSELGVDLILKRDDATVYAWTTGDSTPFVPVPVIRTQVPTLPGNQPGIPVRVSGLELQGQANDPVFVGQDANFVWRHSTSLDFQQLGAEIFGAGGGTFDSWFMGYEVRILEGAAVIRTDFTVLNSYTYSMVQNAGDPGGPRRAFSIEVRIIGRQNQLSQPSRITVNNPQPPLPTNLSVIGAFQVAFISFDQPVDGDYLGVEVYQSQISGFTPAPGNLVYEGPDTNITVKNLVSGGTYYFRIRPYDRFGRTGLNESSELSATTEVVTNADTDSTPPTDPVIGALTTGVNESALTVSAWVKAAWTASTDAGMLTGYIVQYWTDVDTTAIEAVSTNLEYVVLPVVPGRTVYMRVRAQDWAGNLSNWSATVSVVAAGDTTAPALPTSLAATAGLDKVAFTWVNPTSASFLEAKVYVGTTSGFTPGPTNLKYQGRGDTFILDSSVAGTTYYARVSSLSVSGVESAKSGQIGPVTSLDITGGNIANYISPNAIDDSRIGNLDAGKITAGSIAAARMQTYLLTAVQAVVSQLSAISANIGTVTAGNLIGTIIKTAVSGARVEIDSVNGLTLRNATTITGQLALDGSGFLGAGAQRISWLADGTLEVPGGLVAGELIGNIVRTGTIGYRMDIGIETIGPTTYIMRYHNGAGVMPFYMDANGNARFMGDITGASGNFQGDITGASGSFTGDISGASGTFNGPVLAEQVTGSHLNLVGAGPKFTVRGYPIVRTLSYMSWGALAIRSVWYYPAGPSAVNVSVKVNVGLSSGNGGVYLYLNGVMKDYASFGNSSGGPINLSLSCQGTHTTTGITPFMIEARAISGGAYYYFGDISYSAVEVLT